MVDGNDIYEETVSFLDEEAPNEVLTKKQVSSTPNGYIDAELIKVTKDQARSKDGKKDYTQYTLLVRTDPFTEKRVRYVFRSELLWGRTVNPKRVRIAVIPDGEYLKWNISALEVQAKL